MASYCKHIMLNLNNGEQRETILTSDYCLLGDYSAPIEFKYYIDKQTNLFSSLYETYSEKTLDINSLQVLGSLYEKNIRGIVANAASSVEQCGLLHKHFKELLIINRNSSDYSQQSLVTVDLEHATDSTMFLNKFEDLLISNSNMNELYPGNRTRFEEIFHEVIENVGTKEAILWINNLILKYGARKTFVCNVLFAFSHMEYEDTLPSGPTIASAYILNVDDQISEFAFNAFRNWNSRQSLQILYGIAPKVPWIFNKWHDAIQFIEENGN